MNTLSRKILSGAFVLLIISGIITAIYSHTLTSPFVFDDNPNIILNPTVRLQDFSWKDIKSMAVLSPNKMRLLPNLSFALNYYVDGFNVFGFHLVNIGIHIATAFVFYLLALTTLQLSWPDEDNRAAEIAFTAALLWSVHPLQTNGVTYIVQRMTVMATLFCLLALYSYAKARLSQNSYTKTWLFGTAAIFGTMAVLSKENSGILPVIILGYELFFLRHQQKEKWNKNKLLVTAVSMSIIFVFICWLYLGNHPLARLLEGYSSRSFTLGQRLLTEARVIMHYLSLLILPLPSRLNLAYDFPLSIGLVAPAQTILAILALVSMSSLVFLLYNRFRIAAYAIFWLFISLMVESTVIPLEIIFEHRMYMPSMFLILAITAWSYRIADNKTAIVRSVTLAAVLLLSLFTWQRNNVWLNEISIWSDAVAKAPESMRNNENLGNVLSKAGKFQEAEYYLRRAVTIGHKDNSGNFSQTYMKKYLSKAHENLGFVYRELQNYPKAIEETKLALELDPRRVDPLVTLGIIYAKMDMHQVSYDFFQDAANRGSASIDLYNNWAISSFQLGKIDQAISLLRLSIKLDPDHPESHYNLGIAYSAKGLLDKAQEEMALAIRLRGKSKK